MTNYFAPDGQMPNDRVTALDFVTLSDLLYEPYTREMMALAWRIKEPNNEPPLQFEELLEDYEQRCALATEFAVEIVESLVTVLQTLSATLDERSSTVMLPVALAVADRYAEVMGKSLVDLAANQTMRALVVSAATAAGALVSSPATETVLTRNETLRTG